MQTKPVVAALVSFLGGALPLPKDEPEETEESLARKAKALKKAQEKRERKAQKRRQDNEKR